MQIVVLGAGGVGGYYGGLLARTGHDVTLVARGAHLEALRAQGLRVESVHGDFEVAPVKATDDVAALAPADLLLVTVKSYDLEGAVERARGLVGEATTVLPLLNGLDAAERVAALVGERPVLAGLTHISSSVVAPGVIRQVSPLRRITLGEHDGRESERARKIRDVLAGAGIEAVVTGAVDVALWTKFLFIASIGGVCCLVRQPIGPVLAAADTRALYVDALREVEAVARARGVALAADAVEQALSLTAGFPAETRPSMLVDLEAGRRLELESMSGTVVRYGREASVETPVHQAIYDALAPGAGAP